MRTSWLVRLGGVAVAGALVLGPGDAAWAAATIPLNPAHTNTTAQEFPSHECTGPLGGLPSTKDGWHFVLPSSSDRRTAVFTVSAVERVAKNSFPTDRVYDPTAGPELRLVTCGGRYDPKRHAYLDNIIVFARMTGTRPAG